MVEKKNGMTAAARRPACLGLCSQWTKGDEPVFMKKNSLVWTNFLVCLIIAAGCLLTAVLNYRANYAMSRQTIEHVCALTSESIYYQMERIFIKPVNVSLTMANDSLLQQVLREESRLDDGGHLETIRQYLSAYQKRYGYDSVFLVSAGTGRYYHFGGLDRVLTQDAPENDWYYQLLDSPDDYDVNVDHGEAAPDKITVFVNCKIKSGAEVLGVVGVGVSVGNLQGAAAGLSAAVRR